MGSFFGWVSVRRVSLAIALTPLVLIVTWHFIAIAGNGRLQKIATELSSAKEFFGIPGPNHTGTKLFFSQTSDTGVTAFLIDIATGRKKFLYDHEQSHLQGVGLLGWSPDDKMFAYSVRSPEGKIAICDGDSGDILATISESKIVLEGTWLSNESFVYVNKDQNFTVVRKSNDEWRKASLFTRKPANEQVRTVAVTEINQARVITQNVRDGLKDPVKHLVAMSDTSVAWQQGGNVWTCKTDASAPTKVWESTTNTLLDFFFSQPRQVFRLHFQANTSNFVATFYSRSLWHDERLADIEKTNPSGDSRATNLTFTSDGLGYVYLTRDPTLDVIFIKPDVPSELQSLKWDSVDNLIVANNHVFVTGALTNGPLSIWDYDIKSRLLNCAVSGLDSPFRYAKITTPSDATTTSDSGSMVNFRLWPPATFDRSKKYPLVIGFSGRRWRAQEASVPNANVFLAAFAGSSSQEWPEETLAVLQALTKNPNIDTNRVYILGVSAGTFAAASLFEERPELWHGGILFGATYFPNPSRIKTARLLISSGSNDAYLKSIGGVKKLIEFQNIAAKAGIPVTLSIQAQASHVYRSSLAERERSQRILEFLSKN